MRAGLELSLIWRGCCFTHRFQILSTVGGTKMTASPWKVKHTVALLPVGTTELLAKTGNQEEGCMNPLQIWSDWLYLNVLHIWRLLMVPVLILVSHKAALKTRI